MHMTDALILQKEYNAVKHFEFHGNAPSDRP